MAAVALPAPYPREALESCRPRGGYCVSCQMTSSPLLMKGKVYVLAGGRLYTLCLTRRETEGCGGLREVEKMRRNTGNFVAATLFRALVLSTI